MRYNEMFYYQNTAGGATPGVGLFTLPPKYLRESAALESEKGTTVVLDNIASVTGNFKGVDIPETYYKRFCNVSVK